MAAQRLSFIFGWSSKWPLVLPAVLRHRGNIFIMAYIIPKHSFLHGNDPPVLNLPASLIDYIASYKLSMVHKLCSAEHNTAQCRPAGTRTFRAPRLFTLSALAEICLANCAMRSRGLEKRQRKIGAEKSFRRAVSL